MADLEQRVAELEARLEVAEKNLLRCRNLSRVATTLILKMLINRGVFGYDETIYTVDVVASGAHAHTSNPESGMFFDEINDFLRRKKREEQ